MSGFWLKGLALLAMLALAACGTTPDPAPVTEKTVSKKGGGKSREPDWRPQTHTVKKGDTLYAIALEYGYDYKELAELNGISAPAYVIRVGQILKIGNGTSPAEPAGAVVTPLKTAPVVAESRPISTASEFLKTSPKPIKQPWTAEAEKPAKVEPAKAPVLTVADSKPAENKPVVPVAPVAGEKKPPADDEDLDWVWPSRGKLVGSFSESNNSKGIDIAGKLGQSVVAAEGGKVVYSGHGLRGYGRLVIIKHNKTYLSAYAHNSQILVKEGEIVQKGQRIAEMGDTDAEHVKLHFEIRRMGKPVDPLRYLPENG